MKKTTKIKLILLLFTGMIMMPMTLNFTNVQGSIPISLTSVKIDNTWLRIDVGQYIDQTANDGVGCFHISRGGVQLLELDRGGLLRVDDENTLVYEATATFQFAVNTFTLVTINDAFPNKNLDSDMDVTYVEVWKYPSENIYPPPQYNELQTIYGTIYTRTIDFDATVEDVERQPFANILLNVHDYQAKIPISLSIAEDWPAEEISFNGFTLTKPQLKSSIKQIVVSDARINTVGDYDDLYIGQDVKEGGVSVYAPDQQDPSLGSGTRKAELEQLIGNLNLGWEYGITDEGLTVLGGQTGQSITYPAQKGEPFYDLDNNTEQFEFELYNRIKPEISYATQSIEIRHAILKWDYEDFAFSDAGVWIENGPNTMRQTRYPSVHVTNNFIHQEFEATVNILATVQFDPKYGGIILADPFIQTGDFIWDENTEGMTDMDIVLYTPLQDWWDGLLAGMTPIIIIIAVIAVIIIVMFLILKSLPIILLARRK